MPTDTPAARIAEEIVRRFEGLAATRDRALGEGRQLVRLAATSVRATHRGETAEAERLLAEVTGLSTRSIRESRNGYSVPRPRHREALIRAAGDFARARLREQGTSPPTDALAACAAYLRESVQRGGPIESGS